MLLLTTLAPNLKSFTMELQTIQSKIYEIRGQKVILDKDLAEMYGITPDSMLRRQ